jgi:hypothetical protein
MSAKTLAAIPAVVVKQQQVKQEGCFSSCSVNIKIITWKDCDTLIKKISFIFGKSLAFIGFVSDKTFSGIVRVLKFIKFDKIYNLFSKTLINVGDRLKTFISRISKILNDFFKAYIKPIFVNQYTEGFKNFIYKKIFNPLHVKCDVVSDKISKTSKRVFNFILTKFQFVNDWFINPINQKVIMPFNKKMTQIVIDMSSAALSGYVAQDNKENKN